MITSTFIATKLPGPPRPIPAAQLADAMRISVTAGIQAVVVKLRDLGVEVPA